MPLPPSTIRIKRKRGDDSVDILRLESPLLTTSDGERYGYKRRRQDEPEWQQFAPPAPRTFGVQNLDHAPKIKTTKAGDELHDPFLRTFTQSSTLQTAGLLTEPSRLSGRSHSIKRPLAAPEPRAFPVSSVQRKFHLMRGSAKSHMGAGAGSQKAEPGTVFVERPPAVITGPPIVVGDITTQSRTVQTLVPRPSKLNRTVYEGPRDEQAIEIKHASPRFKPRVPALRYQERQAHAQMHSMDIHPDGEDSSKTNAASATPDDDSAYVIDTFVRMPMEMLVMEPTTTGVGLLVLETQVDMEEFYNNASEDDSSADEDEEDENAESHPFNDYPDDEVDSGDEYGRNPYLYRNRNASDEEEFDEDDATFSDDDNVVGTTKSWSRQPPWMRSARQPGDDDIDSA